MNDVHTWVENEGAKKREKEREKERKKDWKNIDY